MDSLSEKYPCQACRAPSTHIAWDYIETPPEQGFFTCKKRKRRAGCDEHPAWDNLYRLDGLVTEDRAPWSSAEDSNLAAFAKRRRLTTEAKPSEADLGNVQDGRGFRRMDAAEDFFFAFWDGKDAKPLTG